MLFACLAVECLLSGDVLLREMCARRAGASRLLIPCALQKCGEFGDLRAGACARTGDLAPLVAGEPLRSLGCSFVVPIPGAGGLLRAARARKIGFFCYTGGTNHYSEARVTI